MKVNFLLVGLILLRETPNGQKCPNTCGIIANLQSLQGSQNNVGKCCRHVESFLDRHPLCDLRDSFEKLCNEERNSKGENRCFRRDNTNTVIQQECECEEETQQTRSMKISGGGFELTLSTCCCGDEAVDCKETPRTCDMKISGKKFNVTMSTSCCGDESGDCTDDDKGSSVPTTSTTTPANDNTTPDNGPSTPTTPANANTKSSTPATDPTDPTILLTSTKTETDTTSMSTNGLEGKDESLHGSTAGSTDTGTLAGGIVGGLLGGVVITVVVVVVWWSCRGRSQRRNQEGNFMAIEPGRSKTKALPVVIPDVIQMSSSSLNVDDHEYHVISETQSRKLETGDYVDIKEEDLQMGNTDYELAGGLNKISINHVEMKNQNSARGENEYKLAGGFQETSNGRLGQEVNDDDYNRLGHGSVDRPTVGTDYDKIGGSEYRGQDLVADYFVLEEEGNQEQYNKLTTVDGQDTYNRLRGAGTDVKVDKQDNKLGKNKGQSNKPKENAYEEAEGNTYNRLGQAGTEVRVEKQDSKLGHDHSSAATDTYDRLGQEGHEEYKKARDNTYDKATVDIQKGLGKDGISTKEDTEEESSEYFVLEEQTKVEQ